MSVWNNFTGFFKDIYEDASQAIERKTKELGDKFNEYKNGAEEHGGRLD